MKLTKHSVYLQTRIIFNDFQKGGALDKEHTGFESMLSS